MLSQPFDFWVKLTIGEACGVAKLVELKLAGPGGKI